MADTNRDAAGAAKENRQTKPSPDEKLAKDFQHGSGQEEASLGATLESRLAEVARDTVDRDGDSHDETDAYGDHNYLSQLHDVPVKVTAVLGSSQLRVEDLTSLNSGSIVELDRKIGDQVDIFVNDHLVAHGEVVINDGRLGISLTEIISKNE